MIKEQKTMKLTIDRSRWAHGEGCGGGLLCRLEDNKMCPLGFLGRACGLSHGELMNQGIPSLVTRWDLFPRSIVDDKGKTTELANKIMMANDNPETRAKKETHLFFLFREAGINVEFVND